MKQIQTGTHFRLPLILMLKNPVCRQFFGFFQITLSGCAR